ncbi:hypothetical protein [Asticcacaulis sp. YBE204]|uniref:hypothetical protein n=1 Tax=Asticcacaulis sp. YBE204 TaxID=1282363 RepID=UPI0003C3FE02|nr:hypothetical protein [Asticcacaulis sp. YBE204]ESQ79997.1 hypothetical protein AEYBE204_09110 [Asticcacaulis sp. YBE204]
MKLFTSVCLAVALGSAAITSAYAATPLEESRAIAADLKASMTEMGDASKAGDMKRACAASRRSVDLLDQYMVKFKQIRDSNPSADADKLAEADLIHAKLSNQRTELNTLSGEICAKAG